MRPDPDPLIACPHCGREGYDRVYLDDKGVSRHIDCGNDVRYREPSLLTRLWHRIWSRG